MKTNRADRRALEARNRAMPERLVEVPRCEWPSGWYPPGIERVWRSRGYLVQLYRSESGHHRLSVNRTTMLANGRWDDGLSWDELQRLKAEAGFADRYAVEVYPAAVDVVNVANMRHLWLLDEPPAYAWRKSE